jgi:hypothetical protein
MWPNSTKDDINILHGCWSSWMRRRSPESPVEDEEPVPPLAKRGRGQPPKARPPGFPTGHAPPVAELLAALPRDVLRQRAPPLRTRHRLAVHGDT